MVLHRERARFQAVVGWMTLAVLSWPLVCLGPSAAFARSVKDAQAAFDKKEYQQALDLVEQLAVEQGFKPEIRRLKVRSLIFLGKPKEALVEYEHFEKDLKQGTGRC